MSGNPVREFSAVVLGAGGVGKSALTLRFMKGYFHEAYDPTIEESYRRNITLEEETSRLEVLDTAGAEQFVALNDLYIKAGKGFLLAFSLTDQNTLKEIESLREQILRLKGDRVPIVVVGTKSDLIEERQVDREQMMNISLGWGVPIYETSAKKNWHVTEAFEDLVRQMRIRYPVTQRSRRTGGGNSRRHKESSKHTGSGHNQHSTTPAGINAGGHQDGRESPTKDKCVAM
ncbi:ras-domain-containing protein [Serendipita vermifera]|nr:ras-domain-containing protein [Serendipita vermifera]